MSGKKTRDMQVRRPGVRRPGALADFILELANARGCLRRLAEAARGLPEGEDYHDARDQVGTMLNRVVTLEERAARWGAG
jgi:hypothetical protein